MQYCSEVEQLSIILEKSSALLKNKTFSCNESSGFSFLDCPKCKYNKPIEFLLPFNFQASNV